MNILALDTAMNACSAAVLCGEKVLASHCKPMFRGQAEALIPLLQKTVKDSGLTFSDIDLIVTTRGPGSFTGLRVGLSSARALALALNIPIVGAVSMDVLAAQAQDSIDADYDWCLVLIETKRQDFYGRFYDGTGDAVSEPFAWEADKILKALVSREGTGVIAGDAVGRFSENMIVPDNVIASDQVQMIDPEALARYGVSIYQSQGGNIAPPAPLYLRAPDVTPPVK